MEKIIQIKECSFEDLKLFLKETVKEVVEDAIKPSKDKTYSINKVSKRLGISYNTLAKRIEEGLIKTTSDNRITEAEIERYLSQHE